MMVGVFERTLKASSSEGNYHLACEAESRDQLVHSAYHGAECGKYSGPSNSKIEGTFSPSSGANPQSMWQEIAAMPSALGAWSLKVGEKKTFVEIVKTTKVMSSREMVATSRKLDEFKLANKWMKHLIQLHNIVKHYRRSVQKVTKPYFRNPAKLYDDCAILKVANDDIDWLLRTREYELKSGRPAKYSDERAHTVMVSTQLEEISKNLECTMSEAHKRLFRLVRKSRQVERRECECRRTLMDYEKSQRDNLRHMFQRITKNFERVMNRPKLAGGTSKSSKTLQVQPFDRAWHVTFTSPAIAEDPEAENFRNIQMANALIGRGKTSARPMLFSMTHGVLLHRDRRDDYFDKFAQAARGVNGNAWASKNFSWNFPGSIYDGPPPVIDLSLKGDIDYLVGVRAGRVDDGGRPLRQVDGFVFRHFIEGSPINHIVGNERVQKSMADMCGGCPPQDGLCGLYGLLLSLRNDDQVMDFNYRQMYGDLLNIFGKTAEELDRVESITTGGIITLANQMQAPVAVLSCNAPEEGGMDYFLETNANHFDAKNRPYVPLLIHSSVFMQDVPECINILLRSHGVDIARWAKKPDEENKKRAHRRRFHLYANPNDNPDQSRWESISVHFPNEHYWVAPIKLRYYIDALYDSKELANPVSFVNETEADCVIMKAAVPQIAAAASSTGKISALPMSKSTTKPATGMIKPQDIKMKEPQIDHLSAIAEKIKAAQKHMAELSAAKKEMLDLDDDGQPKENKMPAKTLKKVKVSLDVVNNVIATVTAGIAAATYAAVPTVKSSAVVKKSASICPTYIATYSMSRDISGPNKLTVYHAPVTKTTIPGPFAALKSLATGGMAAVPIVTHKVRAVANSAHYVAIPGPIMAAAAPIVAAPPAVFHAHAAIAGVHVAVAAAPAPPVFHTTAALHTVAVTGVSLPLGGGHFVASVWPSLSPAVSANPIKVWALYKGDPIESSAYGSLHPLIRETLDKYIHADLEYAQNYHEMCWGEPFKPRDAKHLGPAEYEKGAIVPFGRPLIHAPAAKCMGIINANGTVTPIHVRKRKVWDASTQNYTEHIQHSGIYQNLPGTVEINRMPFITLTPQNIIYTHRFKEGDVLTSSRVVRVNNVDTWNIVSTFATDRGLVTHDVNIPANYVQIIDGVLSLWVPREWSNVLQSLILINNNNGCLNAFPANHYEVFDVRNTRRKTLVTSVKRVAVPNSFIGKLTSMKNSRVVLPGTIYSLMFDLDADNIGPFRMNSDILTIEEVENLKTEIFNRVSVDYACVYLYNGLKCNFAEQLRKYRLSWFTAQASGFRGLIIKHAFFLYGLSGTPIYLWPTKILDFIGLLDVNQEVMDYTPKDYVEAFFNGIGLKRWISNLVFDKWSELFLDEWEENVNRLPRTWTTKEVEEIKRVMKRPLAKALDTLGGNKIKRMIQYSEERRHCIEQIDSKIDHAIVVTEKKFRWFKRFTADSRLNFMSLWNHNVDKVDRKLHTTILQPRDTRELKAKISRDVAKYIKEEGFADSLENSFENFAVEWNRSETKQSRTAIQAFLRRRMHTVMCQTNHFIPEEYGTDLHPDNWLRRIINSTRNYCNDTRWFITRQEKRYLQEAIDKHSERATGVVKRMFGYCGKFMIVCRRVFKSAFEYYDELKSLPLLRPAKQALRIISYYAMVRIMRFLWLMYKLRLMYICALTLLSFFRGYMELYVKYKIKKDNRESKRIVFDMYQNYCPHVHNSNRVVLGGGRAGQSSVLNADVHKLVCTVDPEYRQVEKMPGTLKIESAYIEPRVATHYACQAALPKAIQERDMKSQILHDMYTLPNRQLMKIVREKMLPIGERINAAIRNESLLFNRLPITEKEGYLVGFTPENCARPNMPVYVGETMYEWLEHVKEGDTNKYRSALRQILEQEGNGLRDRNLMKEYRDGRIRAKAFVKIEVALRILTKGFKPRMIKFLEPEYMIHLAPHAYACYKVLKKHFMNPETDFCVITAGYTPEEIGLKMQECIQRINNASYDIMDNFRMLVSGDDNVCVISKKMFESGRFIEKYTSWGRDPTIYIRRDINVCNFCSGGFFNHNDELRFMLRFAKQLLKFSHFILPIDLNKKFLEQGPEKFYKSFEFRRHFWCRALSLYLNFSGCPLMEPIALEYIQTTGISMPTSFSEMRRQALRDKKNWMYTIQPSYRIYERTAYTDQQYWEVYERYYNKSKGELLSMQERVIQSIRKHGLRPNVEVNDVLYDCFLAETDAKYGTSKSTVVESPYYVIEADAGSYDASTQRPAHEQNVWFQETCFSRNYFVQAIDWRKRILIQSRNNYGHALWETRYHMLSGYYDTSIGNAITNMSEMLSSIIYSYHGPLFQ